MKPISEDKADIFCSVFTELKSLGVKVPKIKKFKSSIPKQGKSLSTISSSDYKIFGVNISEQEKMSVEEYILPKFIVTATTYLKKFTKKEIGLFRKAGSVCRQRDLRVKLEKGESIEDSEPNDVASLLKQWLRELPEPLIPSYLQDLFLRCLCLQVEENKISALLLCCHLLPLYHLFTLKHLLEFLSEIANNSDKNKMGAYNLALIIAPNIFVMGTESIDKSSNSLVQQHSSVIELLINNVHRIDVTSSCSSSHVAEAGALRYSTDLDLSIDVLEYSPCKSKKKRKSGGQVLDLFTGIRKLVGQNSVSPNLKKLNPDEGKSAESRSASKRKAEPDQLSMSPLKKLATVPNVLQNDTLSFTPNNKGTQSIFGAREKTGSAHSRRKSFGLLRRKEKKRVKSAKNNVPEDTKLSVATPYPFQEKFESMAQESGKIAETSFQPSSPLLSPLDIELLFSKSIFVKKSVSDCHLTLPSDELKRKHCFSSSSSEGCLRLEGNITSPYNLRSDSKRAVKRKSDVLDNKPEICVSPVEDTDEKRGSGCSPWFNHRDSKRNSKSNKRSSKKELLSPNKVNASVNSSGNNNYLSVKDFNNPCLGTPPAPPQRRSSRRKKEHEDVKNEVKSFEKSVKKSVNDQHLLRCEAKDENDNVPSVSSKNDLKKHVNGQCLVKSDVEDKALTSNASSSVTCTQKKEMIRRKCSITRQESFKIKPKISRKNAMSQLKRADSIKISKAKLNHLNPQGDDLKMNGKKSNSNLTSEETLEKKNSSTTPANVARIKRSGRNGSIVRGKPNTVRTGLPSDACSRYHNELVSTNTKHRPLASTSSVDNDLFINVVNHTTGNKDHDLSITVQVQNITLLSPKEEGIKNVKDCTIQATVSVDAIVSATSEASAAIGVKKTRSKNNAKVTNTTSRRVTRSTSKRRLRLSSNSDSKIHKMKKRPSKVSRIHSFPEPPTKPRPRSVVKLKAIKSSSPRRSLEKEVANHTDAEKENVLVQESSQIDADVFKTPERSALTPEVWASGREFFESAEVTQDEDAFNKRESIAMIVKNNPGHVKAKANMYDYRSKNFNTPLERRNTTPGNQFFQPQFSSTQTKQSQKRGTSVRSNRSGKRNSPLPPPPKFVIPESPAKPSYPLKELTNLNNLEENVLSPSPAKNMASAILVSSPVNKSLTKMHSPSSTKKSIGTPNKDKIFLENSSKKCILVSKRNSYSGHTPFKLPTKKSKVFRSESSPMLARDENKMPKKSQFESQNFLSTIRDNDFSPLKVDNFSSPVFKTRSSRSIEKLKPEQLLH